MSTTLVLVAIVFAALLLLWLALRRTNPPNWAATGTLSMSKQLNVGGATTGTVTYQDSAGANVAVASVPVWSVDNAAVATVAAAADGMSAVVTAVSAGTANITVVAEGDPTPGVDTITLSGAITVVDEASGGTLVFS